MTKTIKLVKLTKVTGENDIPGWFGACKNFRWILVLEKLQGTGKKYYHHKYLGKSYLQYVQFSGFKFSKYRDPEIWIFVYFEIFTLIFLSFFPRRISSQILSIHPTSKGPSKFPLQRCLPWKIDRFWLRTLRQNYRFSPSSKSEIPNL